ncbi:MAG: NAD(P)/FAD-dependent oxidoreductase, partial [Bacteroidales bacterium]|nr:NAD(P)/FAD-dependent oxidoreductase [Bacteroidales bacterium]
MKKVVIIGGGVAGLSAGIYSAMNGFDTQILEMHTAAGGQCTAWTRKGYRFDYCLHWLVGTAKGAFYDIWRETNVINSQTEIIDHDIHSRIILNDGTEFIIYSNIDRWEEYLIGIAPEDTESIKRMCNDMRKSALLEPFALPPELRKPLDYIRILPVMLPIARIVRKFGRLTVGEYFQKLKLKSDRLKGAFNAMYGDRNFSALAFIFMLAWFNQRNAGYIKGGSYPLAQRMAEKFESLGGRIQYRKKVAKIIVRNNVAKGVVLSDGSDIVADYVISAADGFTTIYKMLGGRYLNKKIDTAYNTWELFTPLVQVSFGVNKSVPSEAPIIINATKGMKIGRTSLDYGFSVMNYSYDSTMAPKGKTSIVMRFESPWKLWETLEGDDYKTEKQQIEINAIDCLETVYP